MRGLGSSYKLFFLFETMVKLMCAVLSPLGTKKERFKSGTLGKCNV